jgi:hypothetical protein
VLRGKSPRLRSPPAGSPNSGGELAGSPVVRVIPCSIRDSPDYTRCGKGAVCCCTRGAFSAPATCLSPSGTARLPSVQHSRTREAAAKRSNGPSMSDLDAPPGQSDSGDSTSRSGFLRSQLPFLAILALAIIGVAYTNISHRPLVGYWEFLGIMTGLACVLTVWGETDDRDARMRLIWTQAIHWAAVLVAMNVLLLSGVQQLFPAMATSLVLLILLALGTFLAGLNLPSIPICFLGFALVLAVPAISWVKQSALFLVLAAIAFIGLVIAYWSRRGPTHHTKAEERHASYSGSPE